MADGNGQPKKHQFHESDVLHKNSAKYIVIVGKSFQKQLSKRYEKGGKGRFQDYFINFSILPMNVE